jgi:hypothetical protein
MIHISQGNTEYPFYAIDSEVLAYLDRAIDSLSLGKNYSLDFQIIKRTLECTLQITRQSLNLENIMSSSFAGICISYIGALYSPTFFESSHHRKYRLVKSFLQLVARLEIMFNTYSLPDVSIAKKVITDDVEKCILQFQKFELDEEKLWLWHGWPCPNKSGSVYWAPLYPIYKRLGRSFTYRLHLLCIQFIGTRNVNRVPLLSVLAQFIEQYEGPLDESYLKRPEFIGGFWRKFMTYYLLTKYANGKGSKLTTLSDNWRNAFVPFVKSYLIPSGLFVEHWGEFPNFPAKITTGANTHVVTSKDGVEVKVKLLTDIPLQLTDDEAIHLLFKKIQTDVDIATEWASWAVNDIWVRYKKRIELSSLGQVVIKGNNSKNNGNNWLVDRNNPDHLKNAAATLNYYGHIVSKIDGTTILPTPLFQTAHELGLPNTSALLPHCILLIANHSAITPSFLDTFELFDKNGKQTGFIETDGGYKLIGHKRRRGAKLAQQIILLNDTTKSLVEQIIALTSSIREYLKSKNDDNWRYLLLTSREGFTYPSRVKRVSSDCEVKIRVQKFAESLKNTSSLTSEQRIQYANRFNLSSLRASCAVLVYLRTRSIKEMSQALGHAKLKVELIERYLPAPILSFFQERWIRIFQAGILVEALKESEYLIEVSGFESIHELNEFLNIHALKLPYENKNDLDHDSTAFGKMSEEVVRFGVNSSILTMMLSLQQAVQVATKTVHEKARYWAEISQHLISHIETQESYRPDLQAHLEKAKRLANPAIMDHIIYG